MKNFGFLSLFVALTFVQVGCGETTEAPTPVAPAPTEIAAPADMAAPAETPAETPAEFPAETPAETSVPAETPTP